MKLIFKYSLIYNRKTLNIEIFGKGNNLRSPHKIEQFKSEARMNKFIKLKNLIEDD